MSQVCAFLAALWMLGAFEAYGRGYVKSSISFAAPVIFLGFASWHIA